MKQVLPRIIPCLLLKNSGFVKTQKFDQSRYLGDPINILKIFNDKEVDEIMVLDISATPASRSPNLEIIETFASECFMPLGYGGGITTVEQAEAILSRGVEKICLNTAAFERPELVTEIAKRFGSQSVVVSIDAKKSFFGGYDVFTRGGTKKTSFKPKDAAKKFEELGAGEILINSIDQDGQMKGYDLPLIRQVSEHVDIPVIAMGGCGSLDDLKAAVLEGGASAAAAGSFFVYHGPHRAVLINVPTRTQIKNQFK